MPVPSLDLPQCSETSLYRAIIALLQNDPNLSRVVKTWVAWTGDRDEAQPPNLNRLPYLAIEPVADPSEVQTLGITEAPLTLAIHLVVDGTNVDDVFNLWDAIRACLFPGDSSMQQNILQPNAAYALRLTRSGFAVGRVEDKQVLTATGLITLRMQKHTGI